MAQMHAAVVTSFDEPPHYQRFETPKPSGEHELLVDVLAVGLHPRVRTGAAGAHYTSTGKLPMIPGIDGVGRRPDGTRIYFVADDDVIGTMADKALVDVRRAIELPDAVDVTHVAAAMNPAMSAWVALRRRVPLQPGQSVLVLGATGNAGQMAVQIAKHLGAGRIIAAGRDPQRLAALKGLGADTTVSLAGDPDATERALGEAAAEVDVVLDYLWGQATERTIPAVLAHRIDRSRPLTWIELGSMAGLEITLPSAWLRAARLQLIGSGQGSVSPQDIISELPALAAVISTETYTTDAIPTPLSHVRETWNAPIAPGQRIVFVP